MVRLLIHVLDAQIAPVADAVFVRTKKMAVTVVSFAIKTTDARLELSVRSSIQTMERVFVPIIVSWIIPVVRAKCARGVIVLEMRFVCLQVLEMENQGVRVRRSRTVVAANVRRVYQIRLQTPKYVSVRAPLKTHAPRIIVVHC